MANYEKFVIGNCLESEAFRIGHKNYLNPKKITESKLQRVCELLKEDDFSFEMLLEKTNRETILLAIELSNWAANHNINLRNDKK